MRLKILLVVCIVAVLTEIGFYLKNHLGDIAVSKPPLHIRNLAEGATVSGDGTLEVAVPEDDFKRNTIPRLNLQIDGGDFKMSLPETYTDPENHEKYMNFSVTTEDYANGPHTLRVVDAKGPADVRKVIFRNSVYSVTSADGSLSALLAAKQPWALIVEGADYKPVRTYRGNSSKIRVKWDGKEETGKIRVNWKDRWNHPPDDNYAFRLRIAGEQDRIYTANSISVIK